jgi:penicillin-insensitive murein endopeptidase
MTSPNVDAAAIDKTSASDEAPLSLGYTNSGTLIGGRQFRDTPFMSRLSVHKKSKVSFALPNLLAVLNRAARSVARKHPGSMLDVGELSRKEGGRIKSHLSHQSGRDADVGFYMTDLDGSPIRAPRFLRFDGRGDGRDDPTVRFDDQRNWEFVRALLEDPNEEVRQIFIYAPLRARLLAYAAKVKAPRQLRAKAAAAMMQPVNALPHDDHFHIRISCPLDMLERGCADLPMWRGPGSLEEFGPELLAGEPRFRWGTPIRGVPLENWGGMANLWSVDRGVCDAGSLTCGAGTAASCSDLGDAALAAAFPSAMFEPVAPEPATTRSSGRTLVAGAGTPPPEAFADEGPAVIAEAPADGALAALAVGELAQTPISFEPPAAPPPYCSYEEPNACESPVAAFSPAGSSDWAAYWPTSILE